MDNRDTTYPRQILTQGEITPELLERLQCYRVLSPSKQSREDTEVEKVFGTIDQYRTVYQRPVPQTEQIFKFPRHFRELENNDIRHYLPSPKITSGPRGQNLENIDWITLDRTKSRTPPVSTSSSPSCHKNPVVFSPVTRRQKNEHTRRETKTKDDDEIVRCVPKKCAMEDDSEFLQYSTENTPIKQRNSASPPMTHQSLEKRLVERMTDKVFSEQMSTESGKRRCSADFDSVDSPQQLERRELSARKQLDFSSLGYRRTASTGSLEDLYYSSERCRSPLKRLRDPYSLCTEEDARDEETSRLLLQIVSVLRSRKRKSSDCHSCEDDYERECSKRRRTESEYHNLNYSRQNESDSGYECRINEKPEVIPENCTCALMEKECLKMAETAYRNIRRQDGSAESFIQFRNELLETNSIITESLTMVKKIRQFCEHRFAPR